MYLIHQVVYGYFFYYGLMEGPKDCRDAAELCANICPGGRIPDTNEEMGRTEEIY